MFGTCWVTLCGSLSRDMTGPFLEIKSYLLHHCFCQQKILQICSLLTRQCFNAFWSHVEESEEILLVPKDPLWDIYAGGINNKPSWYLEDLSTVHEDFHGRSSLHSDLERLCTILDAVGETVAIIPLLWCLWAFDTFLFWVSCLPVPKGDGVGTDFVCYTASIDKLVGSFARMDGMIEGQTRVVLIKTIC